MFLEPERILEVREVLETSLDRLISAGLDPEIEGSWKIIQLVRSSLSLAVEHATDPTHELPTILEYIADFHQALKLAEREIIRDLCGFVRYGDSGKPEAIVLERCSHVYDGEPTEEDFKQAVYLVNAFLNTVHDALILLGYGSFVKRLDIPVVYDGGSGS